MYVHKSLPIVFTKQFNSAVMTVLHETTSNFGPGKLKSLVRDDECHRWGAITEVTGPDMPTLKWNTRPR